MITESMRVRAEHWSSLELSQRMSELATLHRKFWEYAVIAQVYTEKVGSRGSVIGFGVGLEPLPAWFAHRGATVVATDQHVSQAEKWIDGQHSRSVSDLPWRGICARDELSNISFECIDMTRIPRHLREFDFAWSAGSMEHIGGLDSGADFVSEQMDCLKPGAWCVHTTEFNVLDNAGTVNEEDLCLYRERDLKSLTARLEQEGHYVLPLDLERGRMDEDDGFLRHPYKGWPHLHILVGEYITTSVALVIQKAG